MKLSIDEKFKEFVEDFRKGKHKTPLDVPMPLWGSQSWDIIDKKLSEEILLEFIRFNIERAKKSMPMIYKKAYGEKKIDGKKIDTVEDFWRVPMLSKDSAAGRISFRERVKSSPQIMMPNDLKSSSLVFKSGGTRGTATPTFITKKDIEIESEALKRCFEYMGMNPGSIVLSSYNPTHKGGELIKESVLKIGATFIHRRTTDSSAEIINTIDKYNVDTLAAVQGPLQEGDKAGKGGGMDFLSLIGHGQEVLEKKIKTLFITGYRLIPEVILWAETYGKNLATTLGSVEAIPQATSTNLGAGRVCKYNQMHVMNGPHYVEVVKEESGVLVPAKRAEEGIVVYTTLAREGTLYIRYAPGDSAKVAALENECGCGLKSRIITDIERIDIPEELFATGCCIG